jgi:hypothetical protein
MATVALFHSALGLRRGVVGFAGFSMGTGAAEVLAATRPGARGAVPMSGALGPRRESTPGPSVCSFRCITPSTIR